MVHLCEREPSTCHHTRALRCLRQVAGKQVGSQRVPPLCYHQSNSPDRAVRTPLSRSQSSLIPHFVYTRPPSALFGQERARSNFSFERGIRDVIFVISLALCSKLFGKTLRDCDRCCALPRTSVNWWRIIWRRLPPEEHAPRSRSVWKRDFAGRYLHACGISA